MNPRIFDRFPVLETPRLILRELAPSDSAELFALRSDEEVTRFQLQDTPVSPEATRALIARVQKRYALKADIRWALTTRDAGAFAGTCAFAHFIPALDRGHVTYELTPRFWGRGLATEAVQAMVTFGHRTAELNRIEAVVVPGNLASARVLQKAGFEEEGLLRAYGHWQGRYYDLRMFSITRGP